MSNSSSQSLGASSGGRVTRELVAATYRRGLLDLVYEAATVHRGCHNPETVQCASLLSVKTGGCAEDCAYCPQSVHYDTPIDSTDLMSLSEVVTAAERAKSAGADRFCMGAAWRQVSNGPDFDRVLDMVRAVKRMGLETCVTLGMLEAGHAEQLSAAGLDYYNHNLDSGRDFYRSIITTRSYDDRLKTLGHVRDAGIKVCCGGILGMGESDDDRIDLLLELASQDPYPESVPINVLVAVEGTPLANESSLDWDVVVRMIATARILMPTAKVRLSAGRMERGEVTQALCFLAGANSIFLGDQLLTTPNPEPGEDVELLQRLGLRGVAAAVGEPVQ